MTLHTQILADLMERDHTLKTRLFRKEVAQALSPVGWESLVARWRVEAPGNAPVPDAFKIEPYTDPCDDDGHFTRRVVAYEVEVTSRMTYPKIVAYYDLAVAFNQAGAVLVLVVVSDTGQFSLELDPVVDFDDAEEWEWEGVHVRDYIYATMCEVAHRRRCEVA